MTLLEGIDLFGTLVFAISGALAAAERKFDLMGIAIIAFVTALGGGTVRDLLIGVNPVGWMQNYWYLIIITSGVILTFVLHKQLLYLRRTLFLFDALGLGVFAIGGLRTALDHGIEPVYAIICGMMTATMGGMIRDVLCNEIPLIFRKEIYASAGLIGAGLYLLISKTALPMEWNFCITVAVVTAIRLVAVKYHVGLPRVPIRRE